MQHPDLHLDAWAAQLGNRQPFYMAIIDPSSRMSFANTHFFRTFQQIAMPDRGKLLLDLIGEVHRNVFRQAIATCMHEEHDSSAEVRMKNGNGQWVRWEFKKLGLTARGEFKLFCLGYNIPGPQPSAKTGAKPADQMAISILRAQQKERARIGHELHDNVNQILTSAHLYVSSLQQDSEDFDFIKNKAIEIILLAIEEVRCVSTDMVMPDLHGNGLIDCLQKLVEDLRYHKRFQIAFRHTDLRTIEAQDQQLKLSLFRIVQEQIKNIIKYSGAQEVEISLHCSNEQIRLLIQDNGRGFDPKTTKHGLGLSGIYERAELLKGRVTLRSAPGKGCALIVTIPLQPIPIL